VFGRETQTELQRAMPTYLWTGKDKFGNKIVQRLETPTAEEAKSLLLERGYTDLELHTSDVKAAIRSRNSPVSRLSAEQELALHQRPAPDTLAGILVQIFRKHWLYFGLWFLLCLYLEYQAEIVLLIYGFGVGLFFLGRVLWPEFPGYWLKRLHIAAAWHRWEEVERAVRLLRWSNRWNPVKVPESHLARLQAEALAGRGKLEQAVKEYEKGALPPDRPKWLGLSLLSGVYDIGGNYDQAIACVREALKEKSDPSLHLSLARWLIRRKHDYHGAQAAISEAEKFELTAQLKAHAELCKGVIELETGDPVKAKRFLDGAFRLFDGHPRKWLMDRNLQIVQGFLCVASAKLGDLKSAREYYAASNAYLKASKNDELLEKCRLAIGADLAR
jgi:tetratricopeptide (TPR) repeat protein